MTHFLRVIFFRFIEIFGTTLFLEPLKCLCGVEIPLRWSYLRCRCRPVCVKNVLGIKIMKLEEEYV